MTTDIRKYIDTITSADSVLSQMTFFGQVEVYVSFDEDTIDGLSQPEKTVEMIESKLGSYFANIARQYDLEESHTGFFGTLIEQEYQTNPVDLNQLSQLANEVLNAANAMRQELDIYEKGLYNLGLSKKIIDEKTILGYIYIHDQNKTHIFGDTDRLLFLYESGMKKLISNQVTPEQIFNYVKQENDGFQ